MALSDSLPQINLGVQVETAEKQTGRPKILGERSRRTLKRAVKQNRKSSSVEISQEFQNSSGISVSSRTVRRERDRELKKKGFHGCAAAHKPNNSTECEASIAMVLSSPSLDCGHVGNCSLE
ncbi:hypothetical protein TNCV_1895141 [Trichonephila clavipes]|nr:hypothetical protein TNCV_1895141 [Trichonephila clavipes]